MVLSRPEVIEYAAKRGLTEETLKKFKIGQFEHWMTMPAFEDGQLRGVKMRNIWDCPPNRRFWQLEGARLGMFNFDAVNLCTGLTWIVKGEIPTMMMDQIGFHQVCAPTGGEGSGRSVVSRWNTALALSARIVVGDNDAPGIELGMKRRHLFDAELYFPPDPYKDLDEWLMKDRTNAIDTLKYWSNHTLERWYYP